MLLPPVIAGSRVSLMIRLFANGLLQTCGIVATGWLVRYTFDTVVLGVSDPAEPGVAGLAAAFIAVTLGFIGLRILERVDAEALGQSYVHQLRNLLFAHMSEAPPRCLQKRTQGGIMLRFIGDLTALRQWISLGITRLAVASLTVAGTLVALTLVSWPLGLTVGAVLISGTFVSFGVGKPLQAAVREARRRRAYLAANLNEKLASMAVVQVSGQGKRERARIDRQSARLRQAMIARARIIGAVRAFSCASAEVATVATITVGALLVATGETTPGTVVAGVSIVGLLTPPLRDLGRVFEYWHGATVSREKLRSFLAEPIATSSRRTLRDRPSLAQAGRVEFRNVGVEGSLREFSAVVEPGSTVAVTGPNGAGKSTLLSLLVRLVDPATGQVLIDGVNVADMDRTTLKNIVGMVSPDLPLLRGSIAKNLGYRMPKVARAEGARVRALCGIDEMLERLPDGTGTKVIQGGVNLSLGQRQRIAFARAMLGNPGILLLDEADANLDPDARKILECVLASYKGTVLMVTHRLESVAQADEVWYMEEGCLVECGTGLLDGISLTSRFFDVAPPQEVLS